MTTKNSNRALLTSVVALILCCSMLIGSTFAWFTDSATSGINTIQAGNLDVHLTHTNKNDTNEDVDSNTTLFDDVAKWEPGAVAYENLTVSNEGNLALKYKLSLIVADQNKVKVEGGKGLSEALKVAVVEGGVDTTLTREALIASITDWQTLASWNEEGSLEATKSATYGVVIYWQPSANDNDWNLNNGKTNTDGYAIDGEPALWIDLGINLVATQATVEEDSFNNQYDKDAVYTDVPEKYLFGKETLVYDFEDGSLETMYLDFTEYTFVAEDFQGEYPVEIYKDWICDYYVTIEDGSLNDGLILVGQYATYPWLGFFAPAGTYNDPEGLLGYVTNGGVSNWTYEEICRDVQIFKCGLVDYAGNNSGDKVKVELRMTSPDGSDTKTVCSITVTLTQEVNTVDELSTALSRDNALITLTDDIDLADTTLTVPTGVTATLDLNGYDISASYVGADHYAMFKIPATSSLTVKGEGNINVSTKATENNRSLAIFQNAGKLTIEGGNYKLADYSEGKTWIIATIVDNRTSNASCETVLTINGGEFTVGGNAINLFRNYPQQGGTAKIFFEGGKFNKNPDKATTYIWNQEAGSHLGELYFNGGVFEEGIVYEDYNGQGDIHFNNGVVVPGYSGNN